MTEPKSIFAPPADAKPKSETETLIDRVVSAKAEAEAPFAKHVEHGGSLSPHQQIAVLIAMVQAIMGTTPKKKDPPPVDPKVPKSIFAPPAKV